MEAPQPNNANERYKKQRELIEAVKSQKKNLKIGYSLFIDTYNLFCNATGGLKPIFEKAGSSRRPSTGEYVRFADVFLSEVSDRVETMLAKETKNSISEKDLASTISKVVSGATAPTDIPDFSTIILFERVVRLFGADFDKATLVKKIERQQNYAWRNQNRAEMAILEDTKRRLIEDDAIDIYNEQTGAKQWTKNYRFYSSFLKELLKDSEDRKLPGFYKSYIGNGRFTTHNEKGVDTSLAVEAISLGYESPNTVQVFCIADTDFLPVLRKLEELGVKLLVFYVGKSIPVELSELESQGQLVLLDFAALCERVINVLLFQFGQYDEGGYIGENADLYRAVIELEQQEMRAEWDQVMYERELEHVAKLAAEYEAESQN